MNANPKPTKQQVEDNFDGNICRCTGYRPILDAMKSFASDSTEGGEDCGFECIDIEVGYYSVRSICMIRSNSALIGFWHKALLQVIQQALSGDKGVMHRTKGYSY